MGLMPFLYSPPPTSLFLSLPPSLPPFSHLFFSSAVSAVYVVSGTLAASSPPHPVNLRQTEDSDEVPVSSMLPCSIPIIHCAPPY